MILTRKLGAMSEFIFPEARCSCQQQGTELMLVNHSILLRLFWLKHTMRLPPITIRHSLLKYQQSTIAVQLGLALNYLSMWNDYREQVKTIKTQGIIYQSQKLVF